MAPFARPWARIQQIEAAPGNIADVLVPAVETTTGPIEGMTQMTISNNHVPNQQRCAPFSCLLARLSLRLRDLGRRQRRSTRSAVSRTSSTTLQRGLRGHLRDCHPRSDRLNEPGYIRATSAGGASVLTINDSPGIVSGVVRDWASQSNIGTVSVLGQQNCS